MNGKNSFLEYENIELSQLFDLTNSFAIIYLQDTEEEEFRKCDKHIMIQNYKHAEKQKAKEEE